MRAVEQTSTADSHQLGDQTQHSFAFIDERAVVHVVDDDEQFRKGLCLLLQSMNVETLPYLSAEHFLFTYRPRQNECILLDLRMPGLGGLELQSILQERHCRVPLIVVSGFAETSNIVRAVKNGAVDFLEKPIEADVLLEKVTAALIRDRDEKRRLGDLTDRLSRLSNREREVMNLLVAAKTTTEIAHALTICSKTVEKHRIHIFEKLHVDSVPMLIRLILG